MGAMTAEYDDLIVNFEQGIDDGTLTIDHVKERINSKYARMNRNRANEFHDPNALIMQKLQQGDVVQDDNATELLTNTFKKLCRVFGRQGHKPENCYTL